MEHFTISGEFIELCKLLKILGWTDTGGHAKTVIADGFVTVNTVVELRKRYKTRPSDVVSYANQTVTILAPEISE